MERLKSVIPADLKRMIGESTLEDLLQTCSSLLDFLSSSPQFQRVISDLTDLETAMCRKSTEAALELKRRGNERFSSGDYAEALRFYSQALRHAPMSSSDMDKNLVATLFVNRAASMQAWYRRGKANASLKKYDIATRDLQVALSMENSSSGKKHIEEDL